MNIFNNFQTNSKLNLYFILKHCRGADIEQKLSEEAASVRSIYDRSRDQHLTNQRFVSVTCPSDVTDLRNCEIVEDESCSPDNSVSIRCLADEGRCISKLIGLIN